jgi:sortase A
MLKKRLTALILSFTTLVGLLMVLYPTLANTWNKRHASRFIASYVETVEEVDNTTYAQALQAAQDYNKRLFEAKSFRLPEDMQGEYNSLLDLTGLGIMAYIEIPKISVTLPIYHGTSNAVLQIAIGHLDWSSLPVGGLSTHAVISGHRGLASARLFTDLPKLDIGDVFYVRVLNELLTYEVDQIKTVKPENVEDLKIVEGKDYFTLVTCTPYGINTHRLLVRGHRIGNSEEARKIYVSSDAVRIEPLIVVPLLGAPVIVLLVLLVFVLTDIRDSRKKRGGSS